MPTERTDTWHAAPRPTSSSPARSATSGRGSTRCRSPCSCICARESSRSRPPRRTRSRGSSSAARPAGENRIESAFRLARARVGVPAPGLRVAGQQRHPADAPASAAAPRRRSPGLRLYEAVTAPRPAEDWLAMATELEGHPDNAAAALLGGLTVSCQREDGRIVARVVADGRRPCGSSSRRRTSELETSHARQRAARRRCRSRDAIFNLQRALLLVHALRVRPLRRPARGDAGSLASAGARGARPGPRGGLALRRSGGPRRLPERRRALDRGPGHRRRAPTGRGAARATSTSASGLPCTIRTLGGRINRRQVLDLHSIEHTHMNFNLRCHLCQTAFPATALWVCDKCLGPLEVTYDYDAIAKALSRAADREPARRTSGAIASCCRSRASRAPACTPASRRSCAPTGSRSGSASASCTSRTTRSTIRPAPTRIASSRSRPRARSSSASRCSPARRPATWPAASPSHAARLGLACYVFIPDDLEAGKVAGASVYRPRIIAVRGNYDDVNRLCTQVADKYGWGFANINLRAYYAEGAKTYGFEIAEQLGWRFPRHVVSPVAGGTLLPRILKGFEELRTVGLVDGELPAIHAAQAAGCAPVVRALEAGTGVPRSGQAEHHRQVDRHRQPGGRLPGAALGARDRRLRRDGRPTTRSSRASSCWPRPKASSPSRPAA